MYKKYEIKQLYTLVKQLYNLVESEDEFKLLMGYVLLYGIFCFKTESNSSEEIKYSEVKSVYNSFEEAITQCHNSGSYSILCELKTKIDKALVTLSKGEENQNNKSTLLENIILYFENPRSGCEEKIRRLGTKLYKNVGERGIVRRGRKDALEHDYESIRKIFGD